jgi:hypothetical protein
MLSCEVEDRHALNKLVSEFGGLWGWGQPCEGTYGSHADRAPSPPRCCVLHVCGHSLSPSTNFFKARKIPFFFLFHTDQKQVIAK